MQAAGCGVSQRAQAHHRLHRVDDLGKNRFDRHAVGMGDRHRRTGDAIDRVKDDEAGAIGQEPAVRTAPSVEGQRAVRPPFDPRVIGKGLIGVARDGMQRHDEAIRLFRYLQP